jgi:hypothetical protein
MSNIGEDIVLLMGESPQIGITLIVSKANVKPGHRSAEENGPASIF